MKETKIKVNLYSSSDQIRLTELRDVMFRENISDLEDLEKAGQNLKK